MELCLLGFTCRILWHWATDQTYRSRFRSTGQISYFGWCRVSALLSVFHHSIPILQVGLHYGRGICSRLSAYASGQLRHLWQHGGRKSFRVGSLSFFVLFWYLEFLFPFSLIIEYCSCRRMLSLGSSKPWPDALEAFNGERVLSGKAIAEYFEPLRVWLEKENAKNKVHIGWTKSTSMSNNMEGKIKGKLF